MKPLIFTSKPTSQFRRDLKRLCRVKDLEKLQKIVTALEQGQTLDLKHRDHPLGGCYKGFRECHIEPDWLLIYQIRGNELLLTRTGSHSELFR